MRGNIALRKDMSGLMTDYAIEIAQTRGLVGQRVAPFVIVEEDSAKIPVMTRDYLTRLENTDRAENGSYNVVQAEYGERGYECVDRGLMTSLDRRKQKRYAKFFNTQIRAAKALVYKILMGHEDRVARMVFNTDIYSANAANDPWDNPESDVIDDILTGLDTLEGQSGMPRSLISMVCNSEVYFYLCRNTAMLQQWISTYQRDEGKAPIVLAPQQIAQVLGIREVIVSGLRYNDNGPKVVPNMKRFYSSRYVQLAYIADAFSDFEEPSAWRTALWQDDCPGFPAVDAWYSQDFRSDMIRVRTDSDECATSEADLLNYLIDTGIDDA